MRTNTLSTLRERYLYFLWAGLKRLLLGRRHKFHADGSLSEYKALLVANGRNQQFGIDCDETSSLVIKPATIRTVLSLAISQKWPIHQLDVKNAFLHGHLSETVYMYQCLFLSQATYAYEILERAHMRNCNPCQTPVDTESKLGPDGDPVFDPTMYRSLTGALQYLTFTLSTTTQLTAYMDADWGGCPAARRSTLGYCVFLRDNLLSWSAKRQATLSWSSVEAEYRGVANVVAETAWVRNLLNELHAPVSTATLVYCDNVSVIYLSANPVQHQRTKHIEIDIHFVRDFVASDHVRVWHVPFWFQYADNFTKGLSTALFQYFI
ncbi:ribonuclease H-like domain-containing protein [Tanacetum coccineum]